MKVGSKRGRFAVIAVPYAWLLVFFLLPFLVVAKISVSEMETTTIKDIVTWKDGAIARTSSRKSRYSGLDASNTSSIDSLRTSLLSLSARVRLVSR